MTGMNGTFFFSFLFLFFISFLDVAESKFTANKLQLVQYNLQFLSKEYFLTCFLKKDHLYMYLKMREVLLLVKPNYSVIKGDKCNYILVVCVRWLRLLVAKLVWVMSYAFCSWLRSSTFLAIPLLPRFLFIWKK